MTEVIEGAVVTPIKGCEGRVYIGPGSKDDHGRPIPRPVDGVVQPEPTETSKNWWMPVVIFLLAVDAVIGIYQIQPQPPAQAAEQSVTQVGSICANC